MSLSKKNTIQKLQQLMDKLPLNSAKLKAVRRLILIKKLKQ